jgi:hypothetical protein
MISICALAVKTGFLFDEHIELLEDDKEAGGDVSVVVSGPCDGEIDMWSPLVGDVSPKLPGILKTGGNCWPSVTSDERGTLTVLTRVVLGDSVPG